MGTGVPWRVNVESCFVSTQRCHRWNCFSHFDLYISSFKGDIIGICPQMYDISQAYVTCFCQNTAMKRIYSARCTIHFLSGQNHLFERVTHMSHTSAAYQKFGNPAIEYQCNPAWFYIPVACVTPSFFVNEWCLSTQTNLTVAIKKYYNFETWSSCIFLMLWRR